MGQSPGRRILPSDWQNKPFEGSTDTASWDQIVSAADVPKLINGFRPGSMDDHWFLYADGPDANGKVTLHMHRSWTGKKVYEVEMEVQMDGEEVANGDARFTRITWGSAFGPEEQSKEMVKAVCDSLCSILESEFS
jgi:hypothetical protein